MTDVRYRILGPLEVADDRDCVVQISSPLRRLLLAALLVNPGQAVSFDGLAELLWADKPPADPSHALQSHVHRLRCALGRSEVIVTTDTGYLLKADDTEIDAAVFAACLSAGLDCVGDDPRRALNLLDEALALWRSTPLAEFTDHDCARLASHVLIERRYSALEARAEALSALGRDDDAIATLEGLLQEVPLRERVCAKLMTSLYQVGRHVEALAHYKRYRRLLVDELGLEPSPSLQELERSILLHRTSPAMRIPAMGGASGLDFRFDLNVSYFKAGDGAHLAWCEVGDESSVPPLVISHGWVGSLDVIAAGRDPRSGLIAALSRNRRVVLYDRRGTGLSRAVPCDPSVDAGAADLESLLEQRGHGPVPVLAISQSGPVALTVAAKRPDLISHLVLLGTYADGPATFRRADVTTAMVSLIRADWGIASRALADMFLPTSTRASIDQLAADQRRAATGDVAAQLIAALYRADVSALLPSITIPAIVLHYLGDRAIPFRGAEQLSSGLPNARLVPLEGDGHLPPADQLDKVVNAIEAFIGEIRGRTP